MKVLMVNDPGALRFRGGDLTQMRQTAQALRRLGVQVAESFDPKPECRGFDLAHVFNLRTVRVTPGQVKHLKAAGLPVVLSPIYLDPSRPLWATHVILTIFRGERDDAERARLLQELKTHEIKAKLPGGYVWTADSRNRSQTDYDRLQRETLAHADHLLPNSVLEMNQLVRTLRVHDRPFTVVPYAADAQTFLNADPTPFVKKHGVRDFILEVGRVEPSKNQLLLVYALRDAGLPVVLIGGSLHRSYLEWCRRHGPKDLKVVPHLPQPELASAFAAARVHVLPSWIETCGLVTMEAALAGCNVVASTAGYELEYYRDLPYYCDPADVDSIRTAVLAAYQNYERDAARRLELKRLILHEYTWERAAELTLRAYSRVLGGR